MSSCSDWTPDSPLTARATVRPAEAEDERLRGGAGFAFCAVHWRTNRSRGTNLWNGASCGNPPHDEVYLGYEIDTHFR